LTRLGQAFVNVFFTEVSRESGKAEAFCDHLLHGGEEIFSSTARYCFPASIRSLLCWLTDTSVFTGAVIAGRKIELKLAEISIEAHTTETHESIHQVHAFGAIVAGLWSAVVYIGTTVHTSVASWADTLSSEWIQLVASSSILAGTALTRIQFSLTETSCVPCSASTCEGYCVDVIASSIVLAWEVKDAGTWSLTQRA
jgi:hypothetical protein